MALKRSIHAITVFCSFWIHSSLQSMEIELANAVEKENTVSQATIDKDTTIKNLGDLKKSWGAKRSVQEQPPDLDATFMAELFSELQHDTSETAHQSHLKKNLIALKKHRPKEFEKLTKRILDYCDKYNGDLSVNNREKVQKGKDSSSSGSQPVVIANISEINNAEIRKLKKKMKMLTLQATEDTIKEKEHEAERNKRIGFAVSIACTLITALGAYYGTLASHPAPLSCPPCSPTSPPALPPTPPGMSPV